MRCALPLLLVGIVATVAEAQFPITIVLESRSGAPVYSPPTEQGKRYRIIVEGTYRMWSRSTGFGVDAVWYHDIPQFGIPSIDSGFAQLFRQPLWVGDTTEYSFPSIPGVFRGFAFSLRRYVGFRLNDQPLPPLPLDSVNHRYEIELPGTGQPFKLQILDSVYSIPDEAVQPRYDDNRGQLRVTIEEIPPVDISVCNIKVRQVAPGYIAVQVDAGILVVDTSSATGIRNVLAEVSQLGVVENGRFICPDSLICRGGRLDTVAIVFVLDRSGSMNEPVSDTDPVRRWPAAVRSLNLFLDSLRVPAWLSLISFADDITLDQDWTLDKAAIRARVNALTPQGRTRFYGALLAAFQQLQAKNRYPGYIIALTDGINNLPPDDARVVLQSTPLGVTLFTIALALGPTPEELAARDTLRMLAAATPRGRFFETNVSRQLDTIYTLIASGIQQSDCCELYFRTTPCRGKGDTLRVLRLIIVSGDSVITRVLVYRPPCDSVVSVQEPYPPELPSGTASAPLELFPNPATGQWMVVYRVSSAGEVHLSLFSMTGSELFTQSLGYHEPGIYHRLLALPTLPAGTYVLVLRMNGLAVTRKLVNLR